MQVHCAGVQKKIPEESSESDSMNSLFAIDSLSRAKPKSGLEASLKQAHSSLHGLFYLSRAHCSELRPRYTSMLIIVCGLPIDKPFLRKSISEHSMQVET